MVGHPHQISSLKTKYSPLDFNSYTYTLSRMSMTNTPSLTSTSITIRAVNRAVLESRVEDLAKKAKKVGVNPPTLSFGEYYEVPEHNERGYPTGETIVKVEATLTYEDIRLSGDWT